MCGIIVFLKMLKNQINTKEVVLHSLNELQNRGYDSVGIQLISKKSMIIQKSLKKTDDLRKILEEDRTDYHIGIGHTRWATTGDVSLKNCHPFLCYRNKITLVHNGIIENQKELKHFLSNHHIQMKSNTDSELVVHLLSYYESETGDMVTAIRSVQEIIKGTYSFIIYNQEENQTVYCVSNGCPLVLGYSDTKDVVLISSEKRGLSNVNRYFCLKPNDIHKVSIHEESIQIFNSFHYTAKEFIHNRDEKLNYRHWTEKEIYQQVEKTNQFISYYVKNRNIVLPMDNEKHKLLQIQHVVLLGCGSSYNSNLFGAEYIKKFCQYTTVQCMDAGEFSMIDIPKNGKVLFILTSQSGETKDLHRALTKIKNANTSNQFKTIGIINTEDSLIAREVDHVLYTRAGNERAVASTKSFTLQILMLFLLAVYIGKAKKILSNTLTKKYIEHLYKLPIQIENVIRTFQPNQLLSKLKTEHIIILGKRKGYSIAREASLKLKELAYVHAEGFPLSSLKHGPFALLDSNIPVIILDSNDAKTDIIKSEILTRNTPIILFHTKERKNEKALISTIKVPYNSFFSELLYLIPLQLLSYHLSISKGINPDYPRNLAKAVVVD